MAAVPEAAGRSKLPRRAAGRGGWPGVFPAVTLILFVAPIGAGLLGTVLPAFGILPALGGTHFTLEPWRDLLAVPGFATALRLTLTTGIAATLLAFLLTIGVIASFQGTAAFRRVERLLAPLLAIPHAALAIGLAFLLAPSGWLARLLSPWLTGWTRPPDLAFIQDPYGVAMTAALVTKEVPFLLLMTLAALAQVPAAACLRQARVMGYGPTRAWLGFVLPLVYGQLRLPLFAVLAYTLSTVEVAMILGPTAPPPLAPLVLRLFVDADLSRRFAGAAGAVTELGIVAVVIGVWLVAERILSRLGARWIEAGGRGGSGRPARLLNGAVLALLASAALASLLVLGLWAVADRWRFAEALPRSWSLTALRHATSALGPPLRTTLVTATGSTALALVLVIGCLEHQVRTSITLTRRALALIYLPLLVPQIGFLFGIQVLFLRLGLDGTWAALVTVHLLFVLPYVFLALSGPYLALDRRYALQASCLGRGYWAVLLLIKLPLLLRPVLAAAAIGFAVSVGQYLPTVFAGAGRLTTLTTEAVALSSGADRRVTAVYAFVQAGLPMLGFALALLLPRLVHRDRRGMAP